MSEQLRHKEESGMLYGFSIEKLFEGRLNSTNYFFAVLLVLPLDLFVRSGSMGE